MFHLLNLLVSLAERKELSGVCVTESDVVLGGIKWVLELGIIEFADELKRVTTPDFLRRHPCSCRDHASSLNYSACLDESTLLDDAAIPYGDIILHSASLEEAPGT